MESDELESFIYDKPENAEQLIKKKYGSNIEKDGSGNIQLP